MRPGYVVRCGVAALAVALCALAGCSQAPSDVLPGYVEGEFVYVASKLAGRLDALPAVKGGRIVADEPLFVLEHDYEQKALDMAKADLAQAENTLRDKEKGLRPEEIDQLTASLRRARSALSLAALEHSRRETLYASGSVSKEELDKARTEHETSQAWVNELEAKLATGRLPQRIDQVMAARAAVDAAKAEVAQAQWSLDQKIQAAPVSGLVFDILHYVGEWVAASSPVAVLLPPENVKVRFFVPEAQVASIRPGQRILVARDGLPEPAGAVVDYVSTQAEYAPPVIFSQGFREKLVFLVEARFAPEVARTMHPGQPVDVRLAGAPQGKPQP
ncbi:HlyD family efflux transporter periplasmic adaptor subunit [Desulfovibrio sulfodismutans]|uniref:HlyD family efflux transporter periplasmic adaptor subunit n=1 Tax=Desulfolutivibrio sulfodismutans TaxID=63561 RepID=A0A7K3NLU3_9BACT|nr:HlyD family efflux transporter periplasmic adaptor subunit [Desulfolutivibrio sulfodismutans]NDY57170.1 HlyD family efflux transporter periplasmic adaptor subunit [Desulfolutivibrio sulfodismutans]QLA11837.1 HlyD family efflux transporter periplasmic adaptor subunit [Desulfolutivibrio sulfodismutans DSM 3696]